MVSRLIHSAVFSAIQATLNQVLSLDSIAQKKLEPLSGKLLRVQCELPELVMDITVCDDRLLLSGAQEFKADTMIKGKSTSLIKLLLNRNTAKLKDEGVVITGNVAFLNALQEILQNLNLDWEYQLSKFIGDLPTQVIADNLDKAGQFTRQSKNNLQQDIDDYLHQEKKIFPSSEEIKDFNNTVDTLRLRVDRLDSRVARVSRLKSPHTTLADQ